VAAIVRRFPAGGRTCPETLVPSDVLLRKVQGAGPPRDHGVLHRQVRGRRQRSSGARSAADSAKARSATCDAGPLGRDWRLRQLPWDYCPTSARGGFRPACTRKPLASLCVGRRHSLATSLPDGFSPLPQLRFRAGRRRTGRCALGAARRSVSPFQGPMTRLFAGWRLSGSLASVAMDDGGRPARRGTARGASPEPSPRRTRRKESRT
jgi:hypothetical protein